MTNPTFEGAYIGASFIKSSQANSPRTNRNPYNLKDILCEWSSDLSWPIQALEFAEKAKSPWASTPLLERADRLKRVSEIFRARALEFETLIIREAGKAQWEAKQEAAALVTKVDITLSTVPKLLDALSEQGRIPGEAELIWKPRGICAVIGPFNFPVHLANGHIIPALLTGNVVIFKPSEETPLVGQLYARCFKEAGFPPGVFQLIQGGAEMAEPLVRDPRVSGIFFTGSYAVGLHIQKTLLETRSDLSTLAALEMGGKNATVVHHDADVKKTVSEVIMSAYATAGQRCSSTSRLIVHESIASKIENELIQLIPQISFGDPSDAKTFMGPMIHEKAVKQYLNALSKEMTAEKMIESKKTSEHSCLVSPSLYKLHPQKFKECSLWQEEVFGPNLVLTIYKDKDDLYELHESVPYGLVTSVFTADRDFFEWASASFSVGLMNLNRGTIGASSKLPFGGTKKSGNNWPAGLFSFLYCVQPQSQLLESPHYQESKCPEPLRRLF